MRIGFVGAPGAGKSLIAGKLVRRLNNDEETKRWHLVDHYVGQTGMAYGDAAHYQDNAAIMVKRWELEAKAAAKGYDTVSCGTIYDTIAWACLLNVVPPMTEEGILMQQEIVHVCMGFFGLMQARVKYDWLFYLPWEEVTDERRHTWEGVIDVKIPEILEGFFCNATVLTGTTKQKVNDALEITRVIRDNPSLQREAKAPVDDEQAVR